MINALLFWFVGSVLKGFQVNGFWWAVGGAILYSIISGLLTKLIPRGRPEALRASPQGHACGPAEPDPRHPDGVASVGAVPAEGSVQRFPVD